MRAAIAVAAVAAALLLGACAAGGPEPIAYGRDACDYCRMVISDARYGAELVTAKGKVRRFDSIECLAAYYLQVRAEGQVRSLWVTDFARPGTLVPAADAQYVRAAGPGSPMGMGLTALGPQADGAARRRVAGDDASPMRWPDVLALVEREGMPRGAAPAHAAPPPGEGHGARAR